MIPGLYIHVPFCKSKCPYCGFYSVTDLSLIPRWISALEREMSLYRGAFPAFDTLYLGGGTPSVLSRPQLERIMEAVGRAFPILPGAEQPLELNPRHVHRVTALGLKALGFNRVNLGVQSFDDRALAFLGRRHSVRDAEAALAAIADAGFHNIGIDLIYGFDAIPPDSWRRTLHRAIGFAPQHLSCYQLTIEKGTPLGGLKTQGHFKALTEVRERGLFLYTSRTLSAQGYIHYEVSNFAREARFRSSHNRKYWFHAPYLGLGPSAHSFQNGVRWWNVRSVAGYCDALEAGRRPTEDFETLNREQWILECLGLGLRTIEGVSLAHIPEEVRSDGAVRRLSDMGLVRVNNRRVQPTLQGLAVADGLPLAMMD